MAKKIATALSKAAGANVVSDYNGPAAPIVMFIRWSFFET
jgi:hypothetical protein